MDGACEIEGGRMNDEQKQGKIADETERGREDRDKVDRDARARKGKAELDGLGQAGTAEPEEGIAQYQGGGIDDAIGGGQSGQGGG
jgi:hypothetical protein